MSCRERASTVRTEARPLILEGVSHVFRVGCFLSGQFWGFFFWHVEVLLKKLKMSRAPRKESLSVDWRSYNQKEFVNRLDKTATFRIVSKAGRNPLPECLAYVLKVTVKVYSIVLSRKQQNFTRVWSCPQRRPSWSDCNTWRGGEMSVDASAREGWGSLRLEAPTWWGVGSAFAKITGPSPERSLPPLTAEASWECANRPYENIP